ncbi:MAG: cytochrome c maturation protein CcmE [Thiohalomonadaceae bacterium]
MNPKRRNRLLVIALVVSGAGIAVALAMVALSENINLFYSPTEVSRGAIPQGKTFRVGGLVREGSVRREEQGLRISFEVTDGPHNVTIDYTGILPDLFREGQGIVAQGRLDDNGRFIADQVLAKHDENYMPPEVAEALIKAENEGELANPHSTP